MHILDTPRLSLIPFDISEADLIHSLFTDPFMRKYLWDDVIIPYEQSLEVLQESIRLFQEKAYGLWKIQRKQEAETLGYVGLWTFFEEPQPQLLYGILEKYTGQGYATEAASKIKDYAFEALGFQYLIAAMDEEHDVSKKLAERIGMSFLEMKVMEGTPTAFYKIERN